MIGEKEGPTDHGFDFSQDKPTGTKGYHIPEKIRKEVGTESTYVTDYFAELAEEKIGELKEEPFFLYFAFHVPHTPIQGREDLVAEFKEKVDPDATHRNPVYAAMVKSMDMAVGRVLDALEANGIAEKTLVVFTSDNGGLTQRYGKHDNFTENLPLRRGKGSAYEGGTRVPTIVRWPGHTKPGSVCETPIITADWLPTFADIAGIEEIPSPIDGVSLRPLLEGEVTDLDRDLFWHFPHYHAGGDGPHSAIRSGDWKLIEHHEEGILELYDLAEDPGESANLATANAGKASKLLEKLVVWRKEVAAQMPTPNPDYDPDRALGLKKR